MKNDKYLYQGYFANFLKQENIYLVQKQVVMQKYFNDRHVDIGFSHKLNVFVWSCVKRLGTSGFKFPAKGSLPVILSSMSVPRPYAWNGALRR